MNNQSTSIQGTAVVTGASSGIGKVYAERLAARGYDLLLIARRSERLLAIGKELQSRYGIRVESLVADLATSNGLAQAVQKITADPSVTVLVNNAGASQVGTLAQTTPEKMLAMIALNVTALSALTLAILPRFQHHNSGTIINVGSMVGFAPTSFVPIYGPTKAYVLNFTQILQQQLAGSGIRVQLVAPSATVSEGWDIAGMSLSTLDPATVMSTEDCVDAALRGLDNGELITLPSLHDASLLHNYETASAALFDASFVTGQPASRYAVTH